jgi:hypothetical protein
VAVTLGDTVTYARKHLEIFELWKTKAVQKCELSKLEVP